MQPGPPLGVRFGGPSIHTHILGTDTPGRQSVATTRQRSRIDPSLVDKAGGYGHPGLIDCLGNGWPGNGHPKDTGDEATALRTAASSP